MEQRSRYHPFKSPGIREGHKVWKDFLKKNVKPNK